jgi:hypothetical protein
MIRIYPLNLDDIWLRPTPEGMVFCGEADGFCHVDLEITMEATTEENWHVAEVRMTRDDNVNPDKFAKPIFRTRYAEVKGDLLKSARDWLYANQKQRLEEWVQQEFLPSSLGAYADMKRAENV